eukprot:UN08591
MRCGEYTAPMIAGEETYIQPGYNGHRVHGLTMVYTNGYVNNVNVHDLASLYGNVYGMRIFDGCSIELKGDIEVNNIEAGVFDFELNEVDMSFMLKSETNPLPQACGVYLYSDEDNVQYDENVNILSQNVIGYRECGGENVIREDQDDYFISQSVGECSNCIVKGIFMSDDTQTKHAAFSLP